MRWSGVPGATGYRVTTYVDGTARPAVQVGAAVGTTTALGVAPGGRVRFEVQAVGSAGAGPRSASSMVAVARAPGARGVVARMYLDVLGRRASERELDGWSARVRAGWTTARVGSAIRRSDEALRREADATYLAGAARLATPAERDSWLRSRRSGSSIARLRSIVLTGLPAPTGSTAPEVDSRWLDDVSFAVGQVHPTQTDEAEGCGPDRQRGLIRIGCADRIQRTVPVRAAIVRQQFASLLGREPDAAGRRYWLAKLASGTPEEDLTIGLLASTEYARRAGA